MRPVAMLRSGWRSVIVCASGPSFTEAQALEVINARFEHRARVIVVNDNYRRVPNADVLYASDGYWWEHHFQAIRAANFAGELWTADPGQASKLGLRLIQERRKPGLTQTERLIFGGGNGGHHAIQLAYLFGASRIALVGFDMRAGDDGAQHWFGEHPDKFLFKRKLNVGEKRKLPFYVWIDRINSMAPGLAAAGVSVLNCSPRSAIECFPKAALADVLADWRDAIAA